MPLIIPSNSITGGFEVTNSLRFDDGSSDYLNKTASAGNRRTFTFSTWLKLSQLTTSRYLFTSWSANNDAGFTYLAITDGDKIKFAGFGTTYLETNQVLRDPSAFYHLVLAVDTPNDTANNRCRIYLNGSEITSFGTRNNPSEDADLAYNQNSVDLVLGSNNYGGSKGNYFDGYLAETVFIDGTQLDATSFGEFDEDSPTIWKPKDVSGLTFGTNGFYLQFKQAGTSQNSSGLGADTSGNDNHFAVNNLTAVDQSIDTCTNNFNTMNPLNLFQYNFAFSEGNLKLTNSANNWTGASGTIAINKGKWYFEAKYTGGSNLQHFYVGFTGIEAQSASDATRNSVAFYNNDGGEIHVSDVSNNATTTADYGTFAQNDIIGVALDYDNELISFYKNGSAIVTNFDFGATTYPSGLTDGKFISPFIGHYASSDITLNFGSPPYAISSGNADAKGFGNFEYSVPSNYFSLCSKNLAEFG
mgnify:CR=1 FL=1